MSRVIRVSESTFRRLQAWGTGFIGSERGTPDKALAAVLDAAGSPPPQYVVVERDLGRGTRFYIYQEPVEYAWHPWGGPFETEADAEAEIARRYAEMDAEYEWVQEQARRDGVTVCWAPQSKEES